MKLSKYKILFISPFSDKSWQIEFSRFTFISSIAISSILIIGSLVLLYFSSPIIKEYLRVSTINREIKQQKEIINNIDESIEEIALMKSYIDSIIGTEKINNLNEDNIRYVVTNNLPSVKPTDGLISKKYNSETKHLGIDLVNVVGTPIFAVASGQVVISDFSDNFGYYIILDHQNGYITHYYHNQENFFKKGDSVIAGDVIAKLGNTGMSTGPHLHFEIWKDGEPIDPITFFDDFNLKSDKLS
jgi:murein DD-endopeptidase MepM/ murein hydrolase activator NlpD|tara:strand:+ start:1608 stop:2339 length:732 start_codon:yes stop_codon:yes gene_type:complete